MYTKIISYGDELELYKYEKKPYEQQNRKNGSKEVSRRRVGVGVHCDDRRVDEELQKRRDNIRRSKRDFVRIVKENLRGEASTLFVTLTYKEKVESYDELRADVKRFISSVRYHWGKQCRYVMVPEMQSRGAVHCHALFWGVPQAEVVARDERLSRLVAGWWGKGFVDVKLGDSSPRIAGYLGKYMAKSVGSGMFGRRAWRCSGNIRRPRVYSGIESYGFVLDEETGDKGLVRSGEFMTQWMGRCNYYYYKKIEK